MKQPRIVRRRRHAYHRAPPGTSPGTLTGVPESPAPTVTVFGYGPGELAEQPVEDAEEIRELRGRWPVLWVNVDGLGDAPTIETIGRIFGLHPLALEDVVDLRHRPKAEDYSQYLFIIARMPHLGDERLESEQISMFLGPDFIITFQEYAGDCFDPVRERLRRGRQKIRAGGPDYLAYALLDAIIDSYFPVLERYGDTLEELEDLALADHSVVLSRIQNVKRDLMRLRRNAWPLREVVTSLSRGELRLISDDTRIYLRDCYDHSVQLMELVENYRELGSGLIELHLSTVSNRMNEIMKVLTIIATIFIPLGFVAGLYGMNFDPEASPWNMPELGWYWGYPFALGTMAGIAIALLVYFRRRGWLG